MVVGAQIIGTDAQPAGHVAASHVHRRGLLGVTDIDGTVPPSLRDELGAPPELHHTLR